MCIQSVQPPIRIKWKKNKSVEDIIMEKKFKTQGKVKTKNQLIKISMLILVIVLVNTVFFVSLVSANLGTYKQNTCVDIKTILNSTSANISTINYPNSTVAISNQVMTKIGQTFNYTFCDTSILGIYIYDYFDDSKNVYVNDFTITPTGYSPSVSQSITMFIIIGILSVAVILFFIFGISTRYVPAKLACLSLCVILIVFTIGYILNIANITIGEFTSLTNGFTPLYIIFIILLSVGGLGIILYLMVFVFKTFQKTRYGIGE